MRRGELGESLNLEVELIGEGRPNRPGTPIKPTKVTIHNTSNPGKGADARAHSKWVRNTGYYILKNGKKNWVSWHFTVDDVRVIRHLPIGEKAWHAGPGNAVSVGVEVCMHAGIDQVAAFDRAARLVATILYDLQLGVDDVVTHRHWTGKACPVLLLSDGHEADKWAAFRGKVVEYLEATRADTASVDVAVVAEFVPVMCDEPTEEYVA